MSWVKRGGETSVTHHINPQRLSSAKKTERYKEESIATSKKISHVLSGDSSARTQIPRIVLRSKRWRRKIPSPVLLQIYAPVTLVTAMVRAILILARVLARIYVILVAIAVRRTRAAATEHAAVGCVLAQIYVSPVTPAIRKPSLAHSAVMLPPGLPSAPQKTSAQTKFVKTVVLATLLQVNAIVPTRASPEIYVRPRAHAEVQVSLGAHAT